MSETQPQTVKAVGIEAAADKLTAVCIGPDAGDNTPYTVELVSGEANLPQLIEFIGSLSAKFGGLERLGIAVPGLVHRETKRVALSIQNPEHSDLDLAESIRSAAGITPVIENDANAAAFGEFRLGAGRDSKDMFYATIGHGVGGAFILDGRIWHGAAGFAGEFGYIALNSDGLRLEDVASTENIVRRTRTRFNRDSTSSLNKLPETSIHIGDIIAAAENGDDFAQLMLERTGMYVGTAVATVINLLNIERVVIGGAIMHAQHLVLDAVIKRAQELSFDPSFAGTEIVAGQLGESAAATGAALLAAQT
ncbi:MAG: ROK family protein [Acidobacteriota bacterium]